MEDPRDGLTLFGPLDAGPVYGIRAGVIGTADGIAKFQRWVSRIQRPVFNEPARTARPPFPGFEAAFGVPWRSEPALAITITPEDLLRHLHLDDRHLRVYGTVSVYADRLLQAVQDEETKPDLWFIVIPDEVWKYCRPRAVVDPAVRQAAIRQFGSVKEAKAFVSEPSLFADANEAAKPYGYKQHFRNQLKARLLSQRIATQVVKESTLENIQNPGDAGFDKAAAVMQSAIAWHLSTAAFYKSGGKPWKVAGVREGVCYLGLVFKRNTSESDVRSACCAAQMFLDSGDGVVFRGAVGPWYSPETGDYHLSREAARDLVKLAVDSYQSKTGHPPKELFLHGRVTFNYLEQCGFRDATTKDTAIVGVKIRDDSSLKVFRPSNNPVLRGMAYVRDERSAYLWTRGWTPRLQTYPGREVPNPLTIEITHGSSSIETVINDVFVLTKLNYNACVFGDGAPITLKFANAVGEVLTAGPTTATPPLPFMYYI